MENWFIEYVPVCVYIYICMCVCVHACAYIYIYIYIYILQLYQLDNDRKKLIRKLKKITDKKKDSSEVFNPHQKNIYIFIHITYVINDNI